MFKVGDRVVRRIGYLGEIDPNSPIGTVEALRTYEEYSTGYRTLRDRTLRVLWEGNKRGYWIDPDYVKLQPKQKQSKPKLKVGDRVELYNCFCEEYNGKQGTIVKICKEIKSFSAVEVRLDQYCCGSWFVRIFVGNLKLLLKEEQKKPAFLSVSGELVEVEVKQEPKKEKLSWAALDELIAKNNAMKFEVGDLVEADVSHTRGIIYEIATNDYGAKVAHVVNVGTYLWFTSLKLIKTAAEMQKVVAAIPVPKHEFAVGDVVKTTLTNQEVLLTSRIDKCCGGSKRWTGLRYDNGFFTVVFSETDLTFVRHSENAAAFAAILNEVKSF